MRTSRTADARGLSYIFRGRSPINRIPRNGAPPRSLGSVQELQDYAERAAKEPIGRTGHIMVHNDNNSRREKNRLRFGLGGKFNRLAIALITTTSLGTAALIMRQDMSRNYQALTDHGEALTAAIAGSSEYAVYTQNPEALTAILDSAATMPGVAYIEILDQTKKRLTHRVLRPGTSIPPLSIHNRGLPDSGTAWTEFTDRGDPESYIEVIAPIRSRRATDDTDLLLDGTTPDQSSTIGYLRLGFSKADLHRQVIEMLSSTMLFASLMILLGVGLTVLTTRRIVLPIRKLAKLTGEIAQGNLDATLEIDTQDEIHELADAFNRMVLRLKQSRRQIDEAHQYLEDKVEARTKDLQQATREAVARAEEAKQANLAKSRFLATMSHEIRTPMTAILGYSELLEEPAQPEHAKHEFIETVRRNGEHLLAIINDLLDLTQIEEGHLKLEISACSPRALAEHAVSLMRERAEANGLRLALKLDDGLPETLWTSELRVRQILVNLVGNAVKFTSSGSVTVHVEARDRPEEPSGVTFRVTDTGPGILTEQLEQIFEPFIQGDSSMQRRFGGTGLGLAISRKLARMLGGDLSVESESGIGSSFRLHLPLGVAPRAETDDPAPSTRQRPEESGREGIWNVEKLAGRVLLVEDGVDNQRLIALHLRRAGLEVCMAAQGQIGFEQAMKAWHAGTPFDVILMDMQMPVLDGYQATRKLREAGYKGSIIALTAHAMPEHRSECLDCGCDDYTTKPIDAYALLSLIRTYLIPSEPLSESAARVRST